MQIQRYKNLINQVKALNKHYNKINEITGENFNVFRILKLQASEVRMHSAFIAELLDPAGSHGQHDLFLDLFVKLFCFRVKTIDTRSCEVKVEMHTGYINEEGTEGGRIDIVVTDNMSNRILIENKIYAGDQKNQLLRYNSFSQNSDLIYLTLDGRDPDEKSKGNLEAGTHYICLSYRTDIINWLEKCRKEVAILPFLRESITQYINLIKYLTNQTLNNSMKDELEDLLLQDLEAAFIVADNLNKSLIKLQNKLHTDITKVSVELGLNYGYDLNLEKTFSGFWFNKPDWKYFSISFQFQSYDKKLVFGLAKRGSVTLSEIPAGLFEKFSSLHRGFRKQGVWPMYSLVEKPFDDWSKYEAWHAIDNGKMTEYMKDKIVDLVQVLEGENL